MSKRNGTQRKRIIRYSVMAVIPILVIALATFAGSAAAQTDPVHFTGCVSGSDGDATVAIPSGAVMSHTLGFFTLETNDEIAVFNTDESVCAGALVWDSTQNTALTVWADNSVTPEVDGMGSGEVMVWKVWDSSENETWDVQVDYVSGAPFFPSGEFGINRIYQLAVFAPTAITLSGMVVETPPAAGLLALVVALFFLTIFLVFKSRQAPQPEFIDK